MQQKKKSTKYFSTSNKYILIPLYLSFIIGTIVFIKGEILQKIFRGMQASLISPPQQTFPNVSPGENSLYEVDLLLSTEGGTQAPQNEQNNKTDSFSAQFKWNAKFVLAQQPCHISRQNNSTEFFCTILIPADISMSKVQAKIANEEMQKTDELNSILNSSIVLIADKFSYEPLKIWTSPQAQSQWNDIALNLQRMALRTWSRPFIGNINSFVNLEKLDSTIREANEKFAIQTTIESSKHTITRTLISPTGQQKSIDSKAIISLNELNVPSFLDFTEHQSLKAGEAILGDSQTQIQFKILKRISDEKIFSQTKLEIESALGSVKWEESKSPFISSESQSIKIASLKNEYKDLTLPEFEKEIDSIYALLKPDSPVQDSVHIYLKLRDVLLVYPNWATKLTKSQSKNLQSKKFLIDFISALQNAGNDSCQEALIELAQIHSKNSADTSVYNAIIQGLGFLDKPNSAVVQYFSDTLSQSSQNSNQQSQDTLELMAATVARKTNSEGINGDEFNTDESAQKLTELARRTLNDKSANSNIKYRSIAILGNSALPTDEKLLMSQYTDAQERHDEAFIGTLIHSFRFMKTAGTVQLLATLIEQSNNLSSTNQSTLIQTLQARFGNSIFDNELRLAISNKIEINKSKNIDSKEWSDLAAALKQNI